MSEYGVGGCHNNINNNQLEGQLIACSLLPGTSTTAAAADDCKPPPTIYHPDLQLDPAHTRLYLPTRSLANWQEDTEAA